MSGIEYLQIFFEAAVKDTRINASHVSVYMALFFYCNLNNLKNPFPITRKEIMQKAKIKGNATYHKCIADLQQYGYIQYHPSYHPAVGSLVCLKQKQKAD